MSKLLLATVIGAFALVAVAAATAGDGRPVDARSAGPLTLALYGDAPYGTTPTDTAELQATPAFIDSINADPNVDLVVHVGDIHSGKQYCTEAYDRTVFDLWTRFADPLVYTPGDNEWTDCHKAGEGGNVLDASGKPVDYANGNPVANLDLIRSIFFPRPGVTLGRKRVVLSQAQLFDRAHPADAHCVENVLWVQAKVLFATVNIPGGSNNDNDVWYGAAAQTPEQAREVAERTGADLRWLETAFAVARAARVKAVMIATQADMWDLDGKPAAHLAAYEPFVRSIAAHTTAFGGPVLLVNGDSHVYRSDDPLAAADPLNALHPGYDVPNFHRLVVHGSTTPLEWLRLTIATGTQGTGPNAFGPFAWQQVRP
jgi:hypothetical protein